MADVVSFRPTREETQAIERIRNVHGFQTRAEAVRYLIREGARQVSEWREDPLFQFEIEGFVEPGEESTSNQIDRALYGGD